MVKLFVCFKVDGGDRSNKCCMRRNFDYRPEFLGPIPKISQNSRNFSFCYFVSPRKFATSPISQQNLQIPGRILCFVEEFWCVSPETALLRVDTPIKSFAFGSSLTPQSATSACLQREQESGCSNLWAPWKLCKFDSRTFIFSSYFLLENLFKVGILYNPHKLDTCHTSF